jgi:exosome complex RNA-binding protein Rrp4
LCGELEFSTQEKAMGKIERREMKSELRVGDVVIGEVESSDKRAVGISFEIVAARNKENLQCPLHFRLVC